MTGIDVSGELVAALEAASGREWDPAEVHFESASAIFDGLNRVLLADHPDRGLEILARTGALQLTLPECGALVGFGEGVRHKDVWAHTKQVVRQTPQRQAVRWAGLLHDVGKVPTRRFHADGTVTFIGHPEVGARMFLKTAIRLSFPPALAQRLHFLIAAHLRAAAYEDSWTDSAVRRFAKDAGAALDDLLDLSRADITSKYEEKVRRGLRQINALQCRIETLEELDNRPVPLPAGLGNAIMEKFHVASGPRLGQMMARLKHDVEDGTLPFGSDFQVYLAYMEENRKIFFGEDFTGRDKGMR